MISVILYGRNDSYGYNLHKRAALSLNCLAEVLTDPSDEILFVDYDGEDDLPTFPEAIQDTLTTRAQTLLRILRVRTPTRKLQAKEHLLELEPIARNVAIRRSNPSSRWILSTNTDMIFMPQRGNSLSDIVGRLPAGIYHAPRIEIPEMLWESLDRRAPLDAIERIRKWGRSLYLNEIVLGPHAVLYDSPGDFQLMLREDLFRYNGFDESMLLGWHVDSNIAKRMSLVYGEVGDLGAEIYGYHCAHHRLFTATHQYGKIENDWKRFVEDVQNSDVPEQAETWGLANQEIEEVRLAPDSASTYVQALEKTIGEPLGIPIIAELSERTYNKSDYDPRHLLPFLADLFVAMHKNTNVAWYGARTETLNLFATAWQNLGFTGSILIEWGGAVTQAPGVRRVSPTTAFAEANVFVFDFGGLPGSSEAPSHDELAAELQRSFLRVVRQEQTRVASGLAMRRFIALNAINNSYERLVCRFIAAALTPYATHMRHGFVLPLEPPRQD